MPFFCAVLSAMPWYTCHCSPASPSVFPPVQGLGVLTLGSKVKEQWNAAQEARFAAGIREHDRDFKLIQVGRQHDGGSMQLQVGQGLMKTSVVCCLQPPSPGLHIRQRPCIPAHGIHHCPELGSV